MSSRITGALKCQIDDSVLLIVDIQTHLGDAMPAKVLNRVLQNSSLLAASAGLLGVPVLLTQQSAEEHGETHPMVAQSLPPSTQTFAKTAFSCMGAEGFPGAIAAFNRRHVVLAGMESHISVLQTALDLVATGAEVFVVEDAICSRRLENYQNALDRMRSSHINVVSAESVVFEWLGDARHPHCNTIQHWLR